MFYMRLDGLGEGGYQKIGRIRKKRPGNNAKKCMFALSHTVNLLPFVGFILKEISNLEEQDPGEKRLSQVVSCECLVQVGEGCEARTTLQGRLPY